MYISENYKKQNIRTMATNLKIGQKAFEIEQIPDVPAEDFVIESLGRTVYQLNHGYPADDPVVGIAFESSMPQPTRYPPDTIGAKHYHYPRSRLISADELVAQIDSTEVTI
jgi:hypothetical protein